MPKLKDMTCLVSRWACLLGLLAVAVVGCSDLGGDGGAGGTGGVGGTGGAGGTGGTPLPDTVTVLYLFREHNPDGDDPPLEGVELCAEYEDSTKECETSNGDGKAVFEFRANEKVTVTIEKESHGSKLVGLVFGETEFGGGFHIEEPFEIPMWTDAQLAAVAGEQLNLDPAYPWEGGVVAIGFDRALEGATFAPVGSTIGEVGPAFYLDYEAGVYSRDLEATTLYVPGVDEHFNDGGFTNVTPGVQQFEVGGAVGDCHGAFIGWPGDTANSLRVPVRAGFTTYGIVRCDVP
jgi:hypothetical protein